MVIKLIRETANVNSVGFSGVLMGHTNLLSWTTVLIASHAFQVLPETLNITTPFVNGRALSDGFIAETSVWKKGYLHSACAAVLDMDAHHCPARMASFPSPESGLVACVCHARIPTS